jgi:hypothetical protein
MKTYAHLSQIITEFFLEWGISDKICRANQKHFYIEQLLSRKSCRLWDNVDKYCSAGQATTDNLELALRLQIHTQIM